MEAAPSLTVPGLQEHAEQMVFELRLFHYDFKSFLRRRK
jgi:hypothetical protein